MSASASSDGSPVRARYSHGRPRARADTLTQQEIEESVEAREVEEEAKQEEQPAPGAPFVQVVDGKPTFTVNVPRGVGGFFEPAEGSPLAGLKLLDVPDEDITPEARKLYRNFKLEFGRGDQLRHIIHTLDETEAGETYLKAERQRFQFPVHYLGVVPRLFLERMLPEVFYGSEPLTTVDVFKVYTALKFQCMRDYRTEVEYYDKHDLFQSVLTPQGLDLKFYAYRLAEGLRTSYCKFIESLGVKWGIVKNMIEQYMMHLQTQIRDTKAIGISNLYPIISDAFDCSTSKYLHHWIAATEYYLFQLRRLSAIFRRLAEYNFLANKILEKEKEKRTAEEEAELGFYRFFGRNMPNKLRPSEWLAEPFTTEFEKIFWSNERPFTESIWLKDVMYMTPAQRDHVQLDTLAWLSQIHRENLDEVKQLSETYANILPGAGKPCPPPLEEVTDELLPGEEEEEKAEEEEDIDDILALDRTSAPVVELQLAEPLVPITTVSIAPGTPEFAPSDDDEPKCPDCGGSVGNGEEEFTLDHPAICADCAHGEVEEGEKSSSTLPLVENQQCESSACSLEDESEQDQPQE